MNILDKHSVPLLAWVKLGKLFEHVASEISRLRFDEVEALFRTLQLRFPFDDLSSGFCSEEDIKTISDAFVASRFAQELSAWLSDLPTENYIRETLNFVGFLGSRKEFLAIFTRILSVGYVDSLRDYYKKAEAEGFRENFEFEAFKLLQQLHSAFGGESGFVLS